MIIDNHLHVFPDQAGDEVGPDPGAHLREMQDSVRGFWGRMVSGHSDPKYIPETDEDVGFRIGRYGRFHWRKHREECWLQRGPPLMERMEHTSEQMLAHMDYVGVDMGLIQPDYLDADTGREGYFRDCVQKWPDRFIGGAAIDYDLAKDDRELGAEVEKLTQAIEEDGFRAMFFLDNIVRQPFDDRRFDPLWKETVRLGVPVYINTGFVTREVYLEEIRHTENVLNRFEGLNVINSHIGGNVLHQRNPEHVDNPKELYPLFETGRFHLEMGYVLAYENFSIWERDYQYPYPRHQEIIQTIYYRFGPRAMVWGFDMPWCQRTCTY